MPVGKSVHCCKVVRFDRCFHDRPSPIADYSKRRTEAKAACLSLKSTDPEKRTQRYSCRRGSNDMKSCGSVKTASTNKILELTKSGANQIQSANFGTGSFKLRAYRRFRCGGVRASLNERVTYLTTNDRNRWQQSSQTLRGIPSSSASRPRKEQVRATVPTERCFGSSGAQARRMRPAPRALPRLLA